jgi:hypothetical protein
MELNVNKALTQILAPEPSHEVQIRCALTRHENRPPTPRIPRSTDQLFFLHPRLSKMLT